MVGDLNHRNARLSLIDCSTTDVTPCDGDNPLWTPVPGDGRPWADVFGCRYATYQPDTRAHMCHVEDWLRIPGVVLLYDTNEECTFGDGDERCCYDENNELLEVCEVPLAMFRGAERRRPDATERLPRKVYGLKPHPTCAQSPPISMHGYLFFLGMAKDVEFASTPRTEGSIRAHSEFAESGKLEYVGGRYNTTPHYTGLLHRTALRVHYATLRYITIHYATLRYATRRHTTLRYATLAFTM